MYLEAWRDFKFVAGNAAVVFLRGPMFSNMLKSGACGRGQFDISKASESDKRERLFLGAAVPAVQSLNGRPRDHQVVDRGGTSQPLADAVDKLQAAWCSKISDLTGKEIRPIEEDRRKRMLSAVQHFDAKGAARKLHRGHEPQQLWPKAPKDGWGDCVPWWAQPEDA